MVETKKSTTTKKTTKEEVKEELAITTPETDDYTSIENDNVRLFTSKKEIAPGIEIDIQTFRVYLDSSKEKYLEFREPDTGECLQSIEESKKRAQLASKKGKTPDDENSSMLKFICSLSIGDIPVTISLLKNLPVKYQYRIIRTIEIVTEGNGSKLSI